MKKSKDPVPNLRPSSPFHKCPTVSIKYSWYVLHCDLSWPVRTGVWGPVHPCWCFWWPRRDGCPTYRRQVFVGRPKETPSQEEEARYYSSHFKPTDVECWCWFMSQERLAQ
jgi:hypothetical protein